MPDRGTTHKAGVGYGDLSVVTLAAATTLLPARDWNGKTIQLNSATGFTVTLPSVALAGAGFRVRFIVTTQPTSGNHVVTEDTANDTNVLIGHMNELTITGIGPSTTAATQVNFIASTADVGDFVDFETDGTNWYFRGQTSADGGSTIT